MNQTKTEFLLVMVQTCCSDGSAMILLSPSEVLLLGLHRDGQQRPKAEIICRRTLVGSVLQSIWQSGSNNLTGDKTSWFWDTFENIKWPKRMARTFAYHLTSPTRAIPSIWPKGHRLETTKASLTPDSETSWVQISNNTWSHGDRTFSPLRRQWWWTVNQ